MFPIYGKNLQLGKWKIVFSEGKSINLFVINQNIEDTAYVVEV